MISKTKQRALLLRLAAALPAIDLVLSQDEGDVVCAWPADRRDIEMVAAGGGRRAYDAWVRPRGPIDRQSYRVEIAGRTVGPVIDEPGLRLIRSGMTLTEAASWLTAALQGRVAARVSAETRLADMVAEVLRSSRAPE